MKKIFLLFIFIYLTCLICKCYAQDKIVDSLKLALKTAQHDTTKCIILAQLAETASDEEWPIFNERLKGIAEFNLKAISQKKLLYKFYIKHLATAYNNMGYLAEVNSDFLKALDYFNKCVKMQEEIGDEIGCANTYNNLGVIYYKQGKVANAIEYHGKSLQLREKLEDKPGIAASLNNVAHIYQSQLDYINALNFYNKSLTIYNQIGDKSGAAITLSNIGIIYTRQNNFDKALECYNANLVIQEKFGNKKEISTAFSNIAFVFACQNNNVMALEYYNRALKIQDEIHFNEGKIVALNQMGSIYFSQKNYVKSLEYVLKSLTLSKQLGLPAEIKRATQNLVQIYKEKKDYKNALLNYELFIEMRDSINNKETQKASIKSQLKYEYEKKAAADSVKVVEEKKLTTVKLKQEKTQRYFLYGGLCLTLVFGVFMFNRFRITQKQKLVIEQQKLIVENQKRLVEEKQKEILDSIRYAKRIQQSLLPTDKYLERIIKVKNK